MEIFKHRPQALEALKDISKKLEFESYTIKNVKPNTKGEGFIGEIIFVTLEDKISEKPVDLVLKLAPDSEKVREIAPIRQCFENEIYFYTRILPEYQKLLDEAKYHTIFAPKCFYTSVTEYREILALENLKTLGFEMFEKTSALDHDHIKFIFETYGQLHGLSFVLQKFKPEVHREISETLHNAFEPLTESFEKAFRGFFESAEDCFIPGKDDEIKEAFNRFQEKSLFDIFKRITRATKHSVLLHGDGWSNNMIFKYDENKKLVDLRLLDFQIMKIGSAACDLSYCLYSGGSKQVLDGLEDYLKLYHQSCASLLRQYDLNIEEIFPFKALKEEWKEFALFGFIMSLGVVKMKFVKSDDILEFKDLDDDHEEAFAKVKYDVDGYNQRMREILRHVFETGLLK